MSLSQAINDIAESMEQEAKNHQDDGPAPVVGPLVLLLKSYARELKTAVKASRASDDCLAEDCTPFLSGEILKSMGCNPDGPAKAEKKRLELQSNKEESNLKSVEVVGGPMGGSEEVPIFTEISSLMPVNARCFIGGNNVYQLDKDGKLHFVEGPVVVKVSHVHSN